MSFGLITNHPDIVGPWVYARTGGIFLPEVSQAIGQVDSEGNLVAGVVFEGYNGASMKGHIAVDPKARLSREFLWYMGHYAFDEIKVNKVIGLVDSSNIQALKVDKKMGFVEEHRIEGAAVGGDLVVLTLTKENYRYTGVRPHENFKRV